MTDLCTEEKCAGACKASRHHLHKELITVVSMMCIDRT